MATTEQDYRQLQRELEAVEAKYSFVDGNGLVYLFNEGVDRENVNGEESDADFWARMCAAAKDAAAFRAEEAGLDINAELGRVIY